LNGHHADQEADDRGLGLDRQANQHLKFLDEFNRVVTWAKLVTLIEQHCPRTLTERPQVPVETTLCIYFMHD
jgi:hypothetical protein